MTQFVAYVSYNQKLLIHMINATKKKKYEKEIKRIEEQDGKEENNDIPRIVMDHTKK